MGNDHNHESPGDTVEYDLYCANCKYNLRTLRKAGLCPECGTPVANSLETPSSEPAAAILAGAMVCGGLGPLLSAALQDYPAVRFLPWICVFVELGCCVGWVMLAARRRRNKHRRLRILCRYALAALSLFIAVFWAWAAYMLEWMLSSVWRGRGTPYSPIASPFTPRILGALPPFFS